MAVISHGYQFLEAGNSLIRTVVDSTPNKKNENLIKNIIVMFSLLNQLLMQILKQMNKTNVH